MAIAFQQKRTKSQSSEVASTQKRDLDVTTYESPGNSDSFTYEEDSLGVNVDKSDDFGTLTANPQQCRTLVEASPKREATANMTATIKTHKSNIINEFEISNSIVAKM